MVKEKPLDVVGTVGATFAGLCCVGMPVVLALLSAIGLGFLASHMIFVPLMVLFLILTGYSLAASWKRHGRKEPLTLFGVSAAVIAVTMWFSSIGFVTGLAGVIAATVMNNVYLRRCAA